MKTTAWVRYRPGDLRITWGTREARFEGADAEEIFDTFSAHEQAAMRAGNLRCHIEEGILRGMAWEQLPYPEED